MFQSFDEQSEGDKGPERLAALRDEMATAALDAFIVPRADAFQGEYVADHDARLTWLTGFTGSAGFCAVTCEEAGVFVDGRYRVQVRAQVDLSAFTPVDWPETRLGPWLASRLSAGMKLGFDPWLHTAREIEEIQKALNGISVVPTPNLVDAVWADQPEPPAGQATNHPIEYAGESSTEKRARLAKALQEAGQRAAVLTLPDSICWLLNIRGSDIPRVPIVHAFAVLHDDGRVWLFSDPEKFAQLGVDDAVDIFAFEAFEAQLATLDAPVRVDKTSAPYAVTLALQSAGIEIVYDDDPCQLPKACKNTVELEGARNAHLRDAVAMVRFLHWVDENTPSGELTEISVAEKLEEFRRETNQLLDISFETISGAGPNGALPHYRVSTQSNRRIAPGDILLVDSGGQYRDGTTDITRTMATGPAGRDESQAFTRVLQGMIAISRARFPRGLAGRDLDALARYPLWLAGQDYDHGTGHGVGSYLSVHEGPQRLSRLATVPFSEGMILSNEPGYYREGAFGIRIENLIIVRKATGKGDDRDHLDFETITFVPIDKRLISIDILSHDERSWLDSYHVECWKKLEPLVTGATRDWLRQATAPL